MAVDKSFILKAFRNERDLLYFDTSSYYNSTVLSARYVSVKNPLIWSAWDIVFSYTTYFSSSIDKDDFMQLAADVIQLDLAATVHHSDGFLIWKSDKLYVEPFNIPQEPFIRLNRAKIILPQNLKPYQAQCALQSAQLKFFDDTFISPMAQKSMLFFRAFLDPCDMITESSTIRLYPSITVHQNGVFQMHFRVMSNGVPISTKDFIDKFLNAPMILARDILVPPALFLLDARKVLLEDEVLSNRNENLKHWLRVNEMVEKFTILDEGGEEYFDHYLISINPEESKSGPALSLSILTNMIGNALETLLNKPRLGKEYQILGKKKSKYNQGDFWSGRPTVYMLDMDQHPKKASEIYEKYSEDLEYIAARSTGILTNKNYLGDSLRSADDYLSYVAKSINLFVYSSNGIDVHSGSDPNGNELVYRLQSQVDFADFISGSLWQCEEISLKHATTVEELISNRENQTLYDYLSRRPFVYGELDDWFKALQKIKDVDSIKNAITFNTTLNLEKFKEKRNFKRQQFQWLMAALLGIIAAGTSGGTLIGLLWTGIGMPEQAQIFYSGLSMAIVGALFALFYKLFVEPLKVP